MTRNEQIRKALKLLAPPSAKRAECEYDIGLALGRVKTGSNAARSFRAAVSKKGKAALKNYSVALRRLRSSCNSLDPAIRPWLSLAMAVSGEAIDLGREIKTAEALLCQPSAPPGPDPSRKMMAVAAAYDLLGWWSYNPAVTRDGKWAQLAKILADDRTFDPFEHMRKFKRSPAPSVEKVQGNHWVFYRTRRPE